MKDISVELLVKQQLKSIVLLLEKTLPTRQTGLLVWLLLMITKVVTDADEQLMSFQKKEIVPQIKFDGRGGCYFKKV